MCVRADLSASFWAERRAATAEGCQRYAGNRGTEARSRAGAGSRRPLRGQSPHGAPRPGPPAAVRGAGARPAGSRQLSAVLKRGPPGAGELAAVLKRGSPGAESCPRC